MSKPFLLKVKVILEGQMFQPAFCVLHISIILCMLFMKLGSNVKHTETMCQRHESFILAEGQGHTIQTVGGFFVILGGFNLWAV